MSCESFYHVTVCYNESKGESAGLEMTYINDKQSNIGEGGKEHIKSLGDSLINEIEKYIGLCSRFQSVHQPMQIISKCQISA